MMLHRETTRSAYADRIERVVAHIGRNLDAPLDLERLAAVACFSPYHFHRIYRLMRGETPDRTVRRLRLDRAAMSLSRADPSIEAIAKRAGYGSVEAFSRAFSNAYGIAPSHFRASRRRAPEAPKPEEIVDMHEVTIEPFERTLLIGYDHVGSYEDIPPVFERLTAWAEPRGLLRPATRYIGVYYDDPDTVPREKLRSFAGIDFEDEETVPEGLRVVELPACRTAMLLYKGPYADLERAYNDLYGAWLPQSGEEPADRPAFEIYLNDCRTLPPSEWLTAIHLPLAT